MADENKLPEVMPTPEGLDEFLATPTIGTSQPILGQENVPIEQSIDAQTPPPGLEEFIAPELREEKYGTLGQKLKTAAEGAASAATFGASTGLEKAFGVKAEDIQSRREENPLSHMAGQAAGLIGSAAIPGVGAANILGKAGQLGAKALGIAEAVTPVAKIGSAAVKGSIENMLFQSGDEVSKMLASDDGHFSESAIANVGLAGILGGGIAGGFGSISPLWKATAGSKVDGILKAITDKAGGVEGANALPDAMEHAIKTSGMDLAPEIRAGLSNDPAIQGMFKTLDQSDLTKSGRALQEANNKFRNDAADTMVNALGKSPESLDGIELSKYEAGKNVGNTLADEYHAQVSPLAAEFEKLKAMKGDELLIPDKALDTPIDYKNPYKPSSGKIVTEPGTVTEIAEKISDIAQKEGWTALPDSDIMREVNKVLKALPEQKTLNDLGKFAEAVGAQMQKDKITNGPLFRAGGIIKGVLRDAEARVIGERLGSEAPELLARFKAARQAYGEQASIREALDSRLHARGSTSGYAKALKEMASTDGESVLRRLSGVNDADVLNLLQSKFPKTAETLRQYHIDSIIKNAADKAKPGTKLNSQILLKSINNMSPELRSFVVPQQALSKIEAVGTMLEQFNKIPHNFSNTARTMDKLMEFIPGSAMGIATMLMGHNPITAAAVGYLTKVLAKDVPDAVRLSLLKYLGSGQTINSGAFKAMVDTVAAASKGEALLSNASKNVFRIGREVLPGHAFPSTSDINKLDKQLKNIQTDPAKLLKVAENPASEYMPNHGAAFGQIAARTVNYLNSLRPSTDPQAPLDPKLTPNPVAIAEYKRALAIAQQPLLVLDKIQHGTIVPQDVVHLQNLYPSLYNRIVQKLTANMTDTLTKGHSVPYSTRIGLSMFMAQPLDSTLTPNGIMSAQPKPNMNGQQGPGVPEGEKSPTKSTAKLSKLPGMYQTPGQAAEQRRLRQS